MPGVALLDVDQLRAVEPHVRGLGALHSPQTAIVDYQAVCESLAEEIRELGGTVRCEAQVARVRDAARPRVELRDGSTLEADRVIVCAGLQADRLARASGQPASPRIVPFRGEYWALAPERAELVRGLVYPVPDPALPFLGIHLSRRIDGSVLIGPNAILTLARERYDRRTAVTLADVRDVLGHRGSWRLFARTGVPAPRRWAARCQPPTVRARRPALRARAAPRGRRCGGRRRPCAGRRG